MAGFVLRRHLLDISGADVASAPVELVVGCPVRQRSWIMHSWFDHVEAAAVEVGVKPKYVFVGNRDDPTAELIVDRWAYTDRFCDFVTVDEPSGPDERRWNQDRFRHMVELRNRLLAEVQWLQPTYFLSLDSDILLHPKVLVYLFESIEQFGAVGGAAYMSETGVHFPNCGRLVGMEGFNRQAMEHVGVIPVDVIMALKLMTPAAYGIDYELHPQGEDIGWSAACARAGVKLGWDNRAISRHVMSPRMLNEKDPRYDY